MTRGSLITKPLYSIKEEDVLTLDISLDNIIRRLSYIESQATVESLPLRWREADFDKSIHGWDVAKRFAENFPNDGKGVMFLGGVGRGKTHLAGAIAKYVIENHHVPVMFKSYATLLDDIRRNYDEDKKEIERVCNIPLLVIDDLGQEKQTEWKAETTFKIINSRYETLSPVVITSNCTVMELRDNVGEAVFSRLFEMCDRVKMSGNDFRMEVKE